MIKNTVQNKYEYNFKFLICIQLLCSFGITMSSYLTTRSMNNIKLLTFSCNLVLL